jgi:uncharacterized membrane protein YqiK
MALMVAVVAVVVIIVVFFARRLRLPRRLPPRLALVEKGHGQLPTDQKGLSRGILDVFCSCPMVRLAPLWAT